MLSHQLRRYRAAATDATDVNFKQVSLLLHGDGTNGAQNNTFLDSSTNNFTITRNGNTTQGTNTPFSQAAGYWSNYFNGTSDVLSVPNSTSLQILSGGDFTLEAWVYLTSTPNPNGSPIIAKTANSSGYLFRISSANRATWVLPAIAAYEFGPTLSLNTWNHVAVCRVGTTVTGYVNGTQYTFTSTNRTTDTNGTTTVGGDNNSGAFNGYFPGYISNARVIKGTALYTANFTPSTIPLTAVTNTSLLTCQSNYFKDNSSNNFAITATGTPSVQPWSPFAPTSAYSTSVNSGSVYFNGTGDYLQTTGNSSLTLGTNSFTIEGWFNFANSTVAANAYLIDTRSSSANWAFGMGVITSGQLGWYGGGYGGNITGGTVIPNTWYHLAYVRNGTAGTLYINGVSVGTGTDSGNYGAVSNPYIGCRFSVSLFFNGYMSNFRIVNGTAVYTSNFTPPTAPLTAITNTSLLLSGTNAAIFDNSEKNNLVTVGNAQISTTVKKYGTGSMSFDGTGDYLTAPASGLFNLSSGNWTVEYWLYKNSDKLCTHISQGESNWRIQGNANGTIIVNLAATDRITSSTVSTGAWHHIALVRSGTTITLYINGTSAGTTTSTATNSNTAILYIGINPSAPTWGFNGYIDELRITNGVARYTANFTPPTAPFHNQ